MATYKTPAVYVEEVSNFPPSVAEVSTAIPAFIGYTSKGSGVERISTMLEYESAFGGAKPTIFSVETAAESDGGYSVSAVTPSPDEALPEYLLYYCMSLYFKNGGGSCYVISVGDDTSTPAKSDFEAGLALLEKEDEPTLILFPEAVQLSAGDYYDLSQQALAQCEKLGDRFVILDVPGSTNDVDAFRNALGTANLMYGAAYLPYLNTNLNYRYRNEDVTVSIPTDSDSDGDIDTDDTPTATNLADIASTQTALYNQIKSALMAKKVTLPPSAGIAGIYARVDRERGVWKAPANVSLSSIIGPSEKVTHEQQEGLNVDPTAGKSINVIREFIGKGTLVWGARTLAGNDNEWRYVPVRRLFILIEESTRKATSFAVFEPNDATTWLKVKGMIESYLYGLWEKGALAGPTPEAAYFVNVGLGKTMTNTDVLEGQMIVEIGIAAVRPAEFIILRFSHKMQEA